MLFETSPTAAPDKQRSSLQSELGQVLDLLVDIRANLLGIIPAPPVPAGSHPDKPPLGVLSLTTAIHSMAAECSRISRDLREAIGTL